MPDDATPEVSSGAEAMAADLDAMDSSTDSSTDTELESPADIEQAETETVSDEAAPDETEGSEEEEPEEDQPVAEEESAPVAAKTEGQDDIPEGVTVRDKNGKKEWVFPESRGRTIYGGYKAAQAAEQVFGEELTPELAESRQQAYISQEMMIGDFMSGDPNMEGRFLTQLSQWSKLAQENGETQHSPLLNLVQRLPQFLSESGDVQALEALSAPVLRAKIDELYRVAADPSRNDLLLSLQHVDNALFGTYKKREQLAAPDPLADREAKLAQRENQLKQADTRAARTALKQWEDATATGVRNAITEEIGTVLKPVEAAYKQFPKDFQGIKDLLERDFQQTLKNDVAWQQYLAAATRRAANAPSAAVRDAVKADLETRYRAKAKYHFGRAQTVKEILSQRAAAMKAQSDEKHKRLQNGAARREPGSVGTPVRQTVRETPNGKSTAESWADAIDAI